MIMMPVWVIKENENEYVVLLGSEPKKDAPQEIIPKNCVKNIIYSPVPHESGYKLAIITISPDNVPENIKSKL